jgi:D-inositol-3-phosphate glycosyltransferase
MTQKHILMISYHTCPLASEEGKESGGMNIYVLELSKQLARIGYQVDVITRSQDAKVAQIVKVSKNFRVIHLKAGPEKPINKKKLMNYIPEFIQSFQSLLKKEHTSYDLIHAHYFLSGLIGLKLNESFSQKIPLIITFHTLALMKNLVARSAAEQENQTRVDAEFNLVKLTDAIITPSSSDKQYLMYLYGAPEKKIFEIPPGVNTTIFKPFNKSLAKQHIGVSDKTKIILFVGRIEPLKGIDVLLYAIKILISQRISDPISLMIIGGDISQHIKKWSPLLKQLEQLSRTLQITANVNFVGQRNQHELAYFYNAAEVVVMPSHYESFGMAAAEAMACGIPVITTNASGISNLIDDRRSALITSVNNPLLLASQIKKLLSDEKLYQEIQKNNLENVNDLSWENTVKQIETVYKRYFININK